MPLHNPDRLRALSATALLDSKPEQAFDRLTRLAARVLGAPVSLVSLVDRDRQFFKSAEGLAEPWLSERQTPLSHSFCQHVVTTNAPLVVTDARDHPLVCDNEAVEELNVTAYLGVPVHADGQAIGSFCVIDSEPRAWTAEEQLTVNDLAALVETEIRLRLELTRTQTAKTESQLERQKLRNVLDALASFVALLTPSGELLDVNEAALKASGLDLVNVAGKPFWEAYWWTHDKTLQREVETLVVRASSGEQVRARLRPQFADGHLLSVDFRLTPLFNGAAEVTYLVASGVDVSERIAVQDTLLQQQEQYKLALSAANMGTWVWDLKTNEVQFDAANRTLWGLPANGDINADDVFANVHRDDIDGLQTDLQAALAGERDYNREFRINVTDDVRWMSGRGAVLRDDTGAATHMLGVNFDVTERHDDERMLAQQAQIIALAHDAIILWQAQGVITAWNRGAERLYGYTEAEALGQVSHELLKTVHPLPLSELMNVMSEQGEWRGELQHTTKAGKTITVSSRHQQTRENEGGYILEINRDISERIHAEAELRDLNRTLEQRVEERTEELGRLNEDLNAFNYSVSHDLRTPLRGIAGFSSALKQNYDDVLDETGQHYLSRVVAGAERMGDLIDDLLDLSRLSRGDLKRRRVNLSDIAREVTAKLRSYKPERKLELSITPDLYAEADYGLAYVVLENLFENAFKFTAEQTHAQVTFGQEGSQFYVRDNGAGFDMAYRDKLFTPFQRLHTQQEFSGNGIGLATVQRVVTRHGGTLSANGEVGKGATFYFTFEPQEAA